MFKIKKIASLMLFVSCVSLFSISIVHAVPTQTERKLAWATLAKGLRAIGYTNTAYLLEWGLWNNGQTLAVRSDAAITQAIIRSSDYQNKMRQVREEIKKTTGSFFSKKWIGWQEGCCFYSGDMQTAIQNYTLIVQARKSYYPFPKWDVDITVQDYYDFDFVLPMLKTISPEAIKQLAIQLGVNVMSISQYLGDISKFYEYYYITETLY